MTYFIATCTGHWPCSREPCVQRRLWVQCAVGSAAGAFTEAALGLALGPVLTGLGAGAGAGTGAMAAGAAADVSAVTPLRDAAALSEVAPSLGLAALSAFGLHLAPKVSAGPQRLDQVGPETETRATVTSGAGLAAEDALAEARAVAGDGIGPSRKCPWPLAVVARVGKNAAYCIIEMPPGSERIAAPWSGSESANLL